MIIPDINPLVYAYNSDAPHHTRAREWWEGLMNGSRPVAIPWFVTLGFVRLMTHPAVLVFLLLSSVRLSSSSALVTARYPI
jgi:uncharacterized protein